MNLLTITLIKACVTNRCYYSDAALNIYFVSGYRVQDVPHGRGRAHHRDHVVDAP